MKPSDWIGYDSTTTNADARALAAKKLNMPERYIEIKRTGGAVPARVRQEDNVSNT